jgi:hypothetical protein
MCQNGNKISEKLAERNIELALHPPYSQKVSPGDYCLFGVIKHNMKDREFQSQQAILSAVAKMWNELTFADAERVLQEWMQCLTCVVGNNGGYHPN